MLRWHVFETFRVPLGVEAEGKSCSATGFAVPVFHKPVVLPIQRAVADDEHGVIHHLRAVQVMVDTWKTFGNSLWTTCAKSLPKWELNSLFGRCYQCLSLRMTTQAKRKSKLK